MILGILSDDLAPGQCLPSTRELARGFHVHPNTISGATASWSASAHNGTTTRSGGALLIGPIGEAAEISALIKSRLSRCKEQEIHVM